jgi:quinol monooxygenase YgiN
MITVVAHNFVKPGCLEEFLSAAKVLEEDTNKLDAGCVSYAMYQNLSDALVVTCIEEWESLEAQANHLKTAYFLKNVQAILPYCARPTEATLYNKLF